MQTIPEEAIRLLQHANVAHLATLMPDGSPKVEPVWISLRGGDLLVTTDEKSIKTANLRKDPRVAISIVDRDTPLEQLLIRGRVVGFEPDDELAVLDEMSERYLGRPFPRRRWSARVVFVIEPDVVRHYRSPLAG